MTQEITQDREFVDGSRVIAVEEARLLHPLSGQMTVYKDIEKVLLEDGRELFRCNSRYGACTMYHENGRSVFAHIKAHIPTDMRKDRAKYVVPPGRDKKVYTVTDDEYDGHTIDIGPVTVGEAAAVVLGAQYKPFEAAAEPTPNGEVELTRGQKVWKTRRENEAKQNKLQNNDPAQLEAMKVAGLAGRIDAAREGLIALKEAIMVLDDVLGDIADDVEKLQVCTPEVAAKAEKYDAIKGMLQ